MCPEITPDFSDVLEGVPAGTYNAQIVDCEQKTSQKNALYLKWKFSIVGASDPRLNGKFVWTNTMVSGPGAFRLQNLFQSATGEKLSGSFNTDTLMGRKITLVLEEGVNKQTGEKTGYAEVVAMRAAS